MTASNSASSIDAFSANVISIRPVPTARKNISDLPYAWRDQVLRRLEHLVRLEPGWDGYDAPHVQFPIAAFAFSMLESICGPNTTTPDIVPGSNGDLQIEWHTLNGDIELDVRAPNDVLAWRSTEEQDGEELLLKNNFSEIARWVADLMEPAVAINAAA